MQSYRYTKLRPLDEQYWEQRGGSPPTSNCQDPCDPGSVLWNIAVFAGCLLGVAERLLEAELPSPGADQPRAGAQSMRMKLIGFKRIVAALLLPAIVAHAGTLALAPQVGDTYEITLVKDSVQQGSNGSSGSSHDKDTIIERVIGLRADGLELQYDLPNTATADDRARSWQFPARVFKPFGGPAQLLNGPELEARLDGWLKAAGLTRTACGHWYFHMECISRRMRSAIGAQNDPIVRSEVR